MKKLSQLLKEAGRKGIKMQHGVIISSNPKCGCAVGNILLAAGVKIKNERYIFPKYVRKMLNKKVTGKKAEIASLGYGCVYENEGLDADRTVVRYIDALYERKKYSRSKIIKALERIGL